MNYLCSPCRNHMDILLNTLVKLRRTASWCCHVLLTILSQSWDLMYGELRLGCLQDHYRCCAKRALWWGEENQGWGVSDASLCYSLSPQSHSLRPGQASFLLILLLFTFPKVSWEKLRKVFFCRQDCWKRCNRRQYWWRIRGDIILFESVFVSISHFHLFHFPHYY